MNKIFTWFLNIGRKIGRLGGTFFAKAFNEHEVILQSVIRLAVGRILSNNIDLVPSVNQALGLALAALKGGEVVSLDKLDGFLLSKLDTDKLTSEEKDLLLVLGGVVKNEIETKLAAQGVTSPAQTLVDVTKILSWVKETAEIRL